MIIKRVVEKILNLFLKEVVYRNAKKEHVGTTYNLCGCLDFPFT